MEVRATVGPAVVVEQSTEHLLATNDARTVETFRAGPRVPGYAKTAGWGVMQY